MTNLESLLKRIEDIERKATERPWHMVCAFGSKDLPTAIAHGDGSKTILEWTEESNSSVYDVRFLLEAANNIEKLVAIIRVQQEALRQINLTIGTPDFNNDCKIQYISMSLYEEVERIAGDV